MPIRVLVVDDSSIVRQTLERELSKDSQLLVVGTAPDPYIARDKIVQLQPDVITLDIEMPRMDGLTFLKKLMKHYPVPVIIVSSLAQSGSPAAVEALRSGAIEVVAKPGSSFSVGEMASELCDKIKSASRVDLKKMHLPVGVLDPSKDYSLTHFQDKVIVIGASTGGTQALEVVLKSFPSNAPATVVAQHMPAVFTRSLAERLDRLCKVEVKEAEDGDAVQAGRVLIAPGNFHTLIRVVGSRRFVEVKDGPPVNRHKPSVEVLFNSAAMNVKENAVGVMLTGMGADGAQGMVRLKSAGAVNIAQDEASSLVFGMPKAAIETNAVEHIMPLDKIAAKVFELTKVV